MDSSATRSISWSRTGIRINPVASLEEAIEKANSLPFGPQCVHCRSNRIETGNLSINTLDASVPETPFGGVKEGGYEREGGAEGLMQHSSQERGTKWRSDPSLSVRFQISYRRYSSRRAVAEDE